MLVAVLYPRLCKDSPDESSETLQNNLSICILIFRSGNFKSIEGRSPLTALNLSTIASFAFKEMY